MCESREVELTQPRYNRSSAFSKSIFAEKNLNAQKIVSLIYLVS